MSRMICLFNEAAKPMVIRPVSIAAFSFYRNENFNFVVRNVKCRMKGIQQNTAKYIMDGIRFYDTLCNET